MNIFFRLKRPQSIDPAADYRWQSCPSMAHHGVLLLTHAVHAPEAVRARR
ncbi:MAG: hypothetical protein KBE25_05555 [Laribacter sp.]|nr:hypothetical protein [Laribacter sp.]MBP9527421.1 hypothetical protein [Laribacter sp.]MBP9608801.1 hypothetical protein [Laribacter sp.]